VTSSVHRLPAPGDFSCARRVSGADATAALGARIADLLDGGEIILLYGELGAGKTCLVQGLCAALQVQEEVVSPTFTLVNTYQGRLKVHHLDFYRVEADHDLNDIGVSEILAEVWDGQAVCLIEWPGPVLSELDGGPRLELLATLGPDPTERVWRVRGVPVLPHAWRELFSAEGPLAC
jgi:tRNA threonylcarbamoyladenosine biosynthesis protein TsaE